MCQKLLRDARLYEALSRIDVELMTKVQRARCPLCGGTLNRADYPRSPRGGPPGLDPSYWRRLGLCCSAEGCRRRSTPPSVRFLGRRVYLGAVVVLACVFEGGLTSKRLAVLRAELGVSRRTVLRWRRWWLEDFASSDFFRVARGMFRTPADPAGLPGTLLTRFLGEERTRLVSALRFLSPFKTAFSG